MNSKRSLYLWRDAVLSLFYPRECALCKSFVESHDDGATCEVCWQKTRTFTQNESLCHKCGRLLQNNASGNVLSHCHYCSSDFYSAARAVGVYEGALRIAVLELKEKPFIPNRLKSLLAQAVNQVIFAEATSVVAVPLHPKREKIRGFNQALLIAKFLSGHTNLPLLERVLIRELYTRQHRAGMDELARHQSIADAFIVKQPRLVKNEKILLIDDVFTSGATVSTCAQTLREAGTQDVFVLTIARAV